MSSHLLGEEPIMKTNNGSVVLMKCKIGDMIRNQDKIQNWEFNRPPDYGRCEEIGRSLMKMENHKPITIDWVLYMDYDSKTGKYNMIDGIHRYEALRGLEKFSSSSSSNNNTDKDGNENRYTQIIQELQRETVLLLYEQYIVFYLRYDTPKENLIELFKNLNKTIPIPELYVKEMRDMDKRRYIEDVARRWQDRYREHFSTTASPNIPNINRDAFIDVLSCIYDRLNLSVSMHKQGLLEAKLEEANQRWRENPPKKLTKKMRDKCEKTGCFLFTVRGEELKRVV